MMMMPTARTFRRTISGAPLVLIAAWMGACIIGAALLSGANLPLPFIGVLAKSNAALPFAVALTLAPLLIYLAFSRPLGLPFAIYAGLAQFDHLFPPGAVGTIAKLGGLLVALVLGVRLLRSGRFRIPGGEIFGWGLFFTWMLISLSWSYAIPLGMHEIQQFSGLFFLFILIAVTRADERDARFVIFSVIGAALGAALFGLISYHSQTPSSSGVVRVTLWNASRNNFVDPNHLAASLQLPFSLLLMAMFRERRPLFKLLQASGCAILAAGMLATGSRTGAIGMGSILLFLLFRSRYRLQISLMTTIALSMSLFMPTVWERFNDDTSGAGGGRFPIWRVAFEAFKSHWLIGHGSGTFIPAYEMALTKSFEPPSFFFQSIESHDIFVYAAVQFGVIGIALLIHAWWRQLRTMTIIPPNTPWYDLRLAIEAGMLALLIESFTLDLLTFKYLWIAFSVAAVVRSAWLQQLPPPAAPKKPVPPGLSVQS